MCSFFNRRIMECAWIIYIALPICAAGNVDVWQSYHALMNSKPQVSFVYYTDKVEWSIARAVCQSLGGDLATIDSDVVMDYIILQSEEIYGYNIFVEEYWVGLVELQEDERFWVADCTNLTYTSNYLEDYDSGKKCFRHKHDHTGEIKECDSSQAFLCQVPSSQSCQFTGQVNSEVLSVTFGITGCESLCFSDPKCWAAVQYVPDNCVQLAIPGHGVDSFNLASKACSNVILNETSVDTDIASVEVTPNVTCSNSSILVQPSSTSISLVTSLGLPACDTMTLTESLTITTTEISTETTTEMSTDTTTEISTETTTEISTDTTTETTTEISTETTTEISTDTTTEISTDTTTEISTDTTTETTTEISTETTTEISTDTTTEISTDTTTEISTDTTTETTTEISTDTTTEISTETTTEISITTAIEISTNTVTTTVVATYTQNITFEQAEEVAAEIVKNLTIDVKSTSSHKRRLTSAEDKRQSSKFVGYIGVIFVTAPLALMMLTDARKLFLDFRSYDNIYKKSKSSAYK